MEVGPVTEQEFWGMYKDVERGESSLNLLRISAKRRIRSDHLGCVYMGPDEHCTHWHWYSRQWNLEQKEDFILEGGRRIRV